VKLPSIGSSGVYHGGKKAEKYLGLLYLICAIIAYRGAEDNQPVCGS
jgi:hypothetical protein